ncbi:MAG: hypothetical protein EBS44_00040 [Betaproteobacteria bacterium]|nr:hypothetical protein [Betaproteobacteria bacterium]
MFAAFVVAFLAFVVWRQPDGTRCSAHVLRIWPKPEDMSGAVHATQHLHRQPVSEQRLIAKVVKRQRQIGDLFAD